MAFQRDIVTLTLSSLFQRGNLILTASSMSGKEMVFPSSIVLVHVYIFLWGVRKLLIASASFDKMQKLESQPHQDTSSVIGNPNAHSWNMFLPFQWHVVALWNRTAMNFHFFHFYFQCHVVLHWKRTALNFHFLFARLFWWPSWLRALRQEIASDELAVNCFE